MRPEKSQEELKRTKMKSRLSLIIFKNTIIIAALITECASVYYGVKSHDNRILAINLDDHMLKNPADNQYRFAVSVWVKTPSDADKAGKYWSIPKRDSALASTNPLAPESSGCERFKANSWAFVLVLYEIVDKGGKMVTLKKSKIWRTGGTSTDCTATNSCDPCHSTLSHLLLPLTVDGSTRTELRVDHSQSSYTFQTLNLMSGMVKDTTDLSFKEAQVFMGGDPIPSLKIDFLDFKGPAIRLNRGYFWQKGVDQAEFWKRFNPEGISMGFAERIHVFLNMKVFREVQRVSKTFILQGTIAGQDEGELELGDAISTGYEFYEAVTDLKNPERQHFPRIILMRDADHFYKIIVKFNARQEASKSSNLKQK